MKLPPQPAPTPKEIRPSKTQYQKAIEQCDRLETRFGLPTFIPFDENELLLGYQKRWVADESPLKIAEKSRRTGITWAEASDAVLTASRTKSAHGTNHFYVGSNKEMAREFIDAAAMWAKAFDKAAGDIEEELFIDDGQEGKEILRRKLRQLKITLNERTVNELVNYFGLKTSLDLFYRAGIGNIDNQKLKDYAAQRSNTLINFFKKRIRKNGTEKDNFIEEIY